MIVDTSAILAILLEEEDRFEFAAKIGTADVVRLSVAGYLEAAIYLDRNFDEFHRAKLDTFLREFEIKLEPVTIEQIQIARQAFVFFGKGRHRAGLNFGDCFTYALAKSYGEPLLFKGNDFSETDLETPEIRLQ
jgi:ribonuclease VapC